MPVKANWENGEQFSATDANTLADAVNAAYVKPSTGVPITDMTASVQVSLGKADTALQSVTATSITNSTTTGRALITAVDAAAGRTTLGVAYGTTAGTVAQGNDSRFSPTAASLTDSTVTGRALITTTDASTARTTLGVAYGTAAGTVAQGNDSRITGAQQTSAKGVANGYASLDGAGKVPIAQLPSSIMEYQGTYNASTNSPSLVNGTGSTGDVYRVSVAGTRNFGAGNITFAVGDYAIYNGSVWEKSDTTDAVSTVAGLTGDVTASSLRGAIATGTPSSTTWLRGDGAWATLPPSGITRSIQTLTSPSTLSAAANTDYVYFSNSSGSGLVSDSFSSSVVTALTFDVDFTDYSATNATWTASAGASRSTVQSKMFASAYFDGTVAGAKITSPASTANNMGTGPFTIEMWAYMTAAPNLYNSLLSSLFGWFAGNSITIAFLDTRVLFFSSEANGAVIQGATAVSLNTWNHVAVCRSGTTTRLFLNGVQQGSISDNRDYGQHTALQLGNSPYGGHGGGEQRFNGYIDDFRITKAARYTANFTPPESLFSYATHTLPTAVGNTNQYTIKDINPLPVVISGSSGQTIESSATKIIIPNETVTLFSDGANWRIV